MMRRLAELAIQAAIQAEEEAAWQAHQPPPLRERAGGMNRCWTPPLATPPAASPSTRSTGLTPRRAGPAWPALARAAACDRPAKHPLVRHGVNDATTDPAQLQRWWQRWPQANLGLATGIISMPSTSTAPPAWPPSASSKDGGPAAPRSAGGHGGRWLAPLVRPHRARQPPTPRPRPRRLARHGRLRAGPTQPPHLRRLPLAGGPRPGAAARGPGRPPRPARPDRPTTTRPRTRPSRPTRRRPVGHPYGRRVLADELAAPAGPPPARNRTLNACAFKVYRYVAGGVLDEEEVTLAFTAAALAIGLDRAETGRTLASARTAGLANPRTVPAPPDGSTKEVGL